MQRGRRTRQSGTFSILQDLLPLVAAVLPHPYPQYGRRGFGVERVQEGFEDLEGLRERGDVEVAVAVDGEVIKAVVDGDVLDFLKLVILQDAEDLHAADYRARDVDEPAVLGQAVGEFMARRDAFASLANRTENDISAAE